MLPEMDRRFLIAALIVFGTYCYLYFIFRADVHAGKPDFIAFYTGGAIVRSADPTALYNEEIQLAIQRSLAPGSKRDFPLRYNHPPFEALGFAPFALLPFEDAYAAWYAINVLMILAVSLLLVKNARVFGKWGTAAVVASSVFYGSLMCVVQGQDSVLLLLLLTLFFLLLNDGRYCIAGALLALATIKPHLVLPELVLLLAQKRWRALSAFFVSSFLLTVISALFLGFGTVLGYPRFLLKFSEGADAYWAVYPQIMANLRGLIHLLGAHTQTTSRIVLSANLIAGIVLWYLARRCRSGVSLLVLAGAVICGSIFFAFHVNPHDLVLLLFPISMAIQVYAECVPTHRLRLAIVVPAAGLYLLPLIHLNFQLMAILVFLLGLLLAYAAVLLSRITLPNASAPAEP